MKDGEMEPLATLGGAARLDDGGPAFPRLDSMEQGDHGRFLAQVSGGMSLRDYFAAKAMQGYCVQGGRIDSMAEQAYNTADAMIKARAERRA